MKFWLGVAIFVGILWYGGTHLGWFDWATADHGSFYEFKQIFNRDLVKQKQIENQKRFDQY